MRARRVSSVVARLALLLVAPLAIACVDGVTSPQSTRQATSRRPALDLTDTTACRSGYIIAEGRVQCLED